jgi:hypothetical protein
MAFPCRKRTVAKVDFQEAMSRHSVAKNQGFWQATLILSKWKRNVDFGVSGGNGQSFAEAGSARERHYLIIIKRYCCFET